MFARLDRFDFANFSLDNTLAALDAFPPGRLRNVTLSYFDKPEVVTILAHPHMQAIEERSLNRPLLDFEVFGWS